MVKISLGKNSSGYGDFKETPFYIEKDGVIIKKFKTENLMKSYYNRFVRPKGKRNINKNLF